MKIKGWQAIRRNFDLQTRPLCVQRCNDMPSQPVSSTFRLQLLWNACASQLSIAKRNYNHSLRKLKLRKFFYKNSKLTPGLSKSISFCVKDLITRADKTSSIMSKSTNYAGRCHSNRNFIRKSAANQLRKVQHKRLIGVDSV